MASSVAHAVREPGHGARGTVFRQRVNVTYEYAVHFTRGLFDPDNPVLADCLAEREPGRRHRVAVFVDAGVLAARPSLAAEIERARVLVEQWTEQYGKAEQ